MSAEPANTPNLEELQREAREILARRAREAQADAAEHELPKAERHEAGAPVDDTPAFDYSDEPLAAGFRRANGAVLPAPNHQAQTPEPPPLLELSPVSDWAEKAPPPPRDWIIEGFIPAGRVTSFLGNGGLGKSIIAGQIGVHVAINRSIFGLSVKGGAVLGLFCEDERDELERRVRDAVVGENLELAQLKRLFALSRDGEDNVLCTFDHDRIVLTEFHQRLEATVANARPRLLILDTAADLFAGDYMSTPHVRQFIKVALGRLCVRYGTAVLLIAHPSASGLNSGDGGGFSTAWNNSVRSRLFLRRPKVEDVDAAKDRRVLEVKKSNYAADGVAIPLIYHRGYFIPDPAPLDEGTAKVVRPAKLDTKLAVAAMEYMRAQAGTGTVVIKFAALYEHLQRTAALPAGAFETVRKQLQRTLNTLEKSNLIQKTKVPLGCYRLVTESS